MSIQAINIQQNICDKGISCVITTKNDTFKRFIRVTTLSPAYSIQLQPITALQKSEQDLKLSKTNHVKGIYGKDVQEEIDKIREKGVWVLNGPRTLSETNSDLREWNTNFIQYTRINELQQLILNDVEIILYPTFGSNHQFVVILCEYGPLFPVSSWWSDIKNRKSILDNYPNLSNLDKMITLNMNGNVVPLIREKHYRQYRVLHHKFLNSLLSQFYQEPEIDITHLKLLENIGKSYHIYDKVQPYTFVETKNLEKINHHESRVLTMQSFFTLQPGNILNVVGKKPKFYHWLSYFCFADLVQTKTKDNVEPVYRFMIHAGKAQPPGFLEIDPLDLRLDAFQKFDKVERDQKVDFLANMFTILDIVYESSTTSTIARVSKFSSEINEFDETIFEQCKSYEDLLVLLANQLTHQNVMGKESIVFPIYMLLRQFGENRILDTNKGGSNIQNLPNFCHLSSKSMNTRNMIVTLLLLLLKLEKEKTSGHPLSNITLIVSEKILIKELTRKSVFYYLQTQMEKGLRIIIYSGRNKVKNLFPTLYLDCKNPEQLTEPMIEFKDSHKLRVEIPILSNEEFSLVEEYKMQEIKKHIHSERNLVKKESKPETRTYEWDDKKRENLLEYFLPLIIPVSVSALLLIGVLLIFYHLREWNKNRIKKLQESRKRVKRAKVVHFSPQLLHSFTTTNDITSLVLTQEGVFVIRSVDEGD